VCVRAGACWNSCRDVGTLQGAVHLANHSNRDGEEKHEQTGAFEDGTERYEEAGSSYRAVCRGLVIRSHDDALMRSGGRGVLLIRTKQSHMDSLKESWIFLEVVSAVQSYLRQGLYYY
jgi:hypothetical protein